MDTSSEKGLIAPKTIKVRKTAVKQAVQQNQQVSQVPVEAVASRLDSPDVVPPALPKSHAEGSPPSVVSSDAPIVSIEWSGELVKDQQSNFYAVVRGAGNPCVYRLRGKEMRALVGELLRKSGDRPRKRAVDDVLDELQAKAE